MTNKTDLTQFEGATEGPWAARPKCKKGRFDGYYAPFVGQEYGSGGTVLNIQVRGIEPEEVWLGLNDADARLIAAAPTLLSELKSEREENAELQAQVERLRASLELFVDQYAYCSDSEIKKSSGHFSDRILIARAALSSTGEEKTKRQKALQELAHSDSELLEDNGKGVGCDQRHKRTNNQN